MSSAAHNSRIQQQALADMYHQVRAEEAAKVITIHQSRWARLKEFGEGFVNGYVLAVVVRKMFR